VNRPDPSRVFALNSDGTGELVMELEPVYSNGIVIEASGDIVWVESYTNAVKRRTRDGRIIELCVLPDKGKPDGLKIAKNGDLYISALLAKGLDVVKPDGTYAGFIAVGRAPTNCAFVGSELYVTDGGHLGMSATPEMAGALWRVSLDEATGLDLFQGHVGGRE
jgi:gluconolactonase